jgi:F-box-like
MVRLNELPGETLFAIFRELMPRDLGRLCQSCREFNDLIQSNYLLYRDVYLQRWVCIGGLLE